MECFKHRDDIIRTVKVPLLDLKAQLEPIQSDILRAIQDVLSSQHFIMGEQVARLEEELAHYTQTPYSVACASGSDALLLSLMATDLRAGEGVMTVPFTFFATVSAITRLGGHPFFVDIDPQTYNLAPHALKNFLTKECEKRGTACFHKRTGKRIHSIIPVHLFGQCAEMEPINALAKEWGFLVIEDAAQALGATYKDCPAGTWGDVACFSFFPSKNLGAMGDGGLITTKNADTAERLRVLRLHGSKPKYYHKVVGINSRLDTLQAAILLVKLKYLDAWAEGRRKNAKTYDLALRDLLPNIQVPVIRPENHTVYNQYCIRAENRDELRKTLQTAGIGTEVYYPLPLHLQECFSDLGYKTGDFPESERAAREILALPVYPELPAAAQEYVIRQIQNYYRLAPVQPARNAS